MFKTISLSLTLFLASCGLYVGSEGVKIQTGGLTGFRTEELDAKIQSEIEKAYELGYAHAPKPEAPALDDGSITVVTGDELKDATGGFIKDSIPFGGAGVAILALIFGAFRTIRKRKKAKK